MAAGGIPTETRLLGGRRQVVVRARDLHGALRSTTNFGTWRERKLSTFVDGLDYAHVLARPGAAGRVDALLAPRVALRVALLERRGGPSGVVSSIEAMVADEGATPPESTDVVAAEGAPVGRWQFPKVRRETIETSSTSRNSRRRSA